jgi:hypothetical protein
LAVGVALTPADIYTIAVGPWTGADPTQEVTSFGQVSISTNFDDGTQLSFDVLGGSPEAAQISELATDVWVYQLGAVWLRCRVVAVEQAWGENGEDVATVTAVCYKRLLNARHVQSPLSYTATDQAQIVWGLIQHTQAQTGGTLGITAGTLNGGSVNRDRQYVPGENIGKVLADLSTVLNGPWWGVDGNRLLQVRPLSAFAANTTPLMLGATARKLSRRSGAAQFANSAFVDGDNASTVPVSVNSATIATDPRGRWERAAGFPTVVEQQTLVEKANGLVATSVSPAAAWSVEVEPARYLTDANFDVGETVEVVVPPSAVAPLGTPSLTVIARIMNVSVSLGADNTASASMELIEVPA